VLASKQSQSSDKTVQPFQFSLDQRVRLMLAHDEKFVRRISAPLQSPSNSCAMSSRS
jgi:hypothetical protein